MSHSYFEMMEAAKEYVAEVKPKLDEPSKVGEFMAPLVSDLTQEIMYVASLDTKNRLIKLDEVTKGLVDRVQSHPREIFKPAILNSASKIIMIHNHPSGDTTPSKADINMTKNMKLAGEILGIEICDHIVVSKCEYTSLRSEGLM